MRILMVGALSLPYIYDNWVSSIKKMYDVDFIDVSILSNNKRKYPEQYIYSIIRKGNYDYLFFYPDAIKFDFFEPFFQTVRRAGLRIITFYADDEPEIWFNQNKPCDHYYDLIGSHSSRGVQRRVKSGATTKVMYLPWGFNPNLFYRIDGCRKIYDVVCFGASKHNANLYTQEGDWRKNLLVNVFEFCQKNGLVFKLFGDGWEQHPILSACAGGFVTNEEMVKIYNQSKIVFNPGFSADKDNSAYQTKLRHFEVPGCGAFQLTNYNLELADLFVEDESIVFFHSQADLQEKIQYYLDNEHDRQAIADKGYEHVHQFHTMEKRVSSLFERAQVLYPIVPKYNAQYQKANIRTLRFNTLDETYSALKEFTINEIHEEDFDFVQIITGNMKVQNIEKSIVYLPSFKTDIDLIGVRSYLQLDSFYNDPMQRKSQNMIGVTIPELLKKRLQHDLVLDYMRQQMLSLEDDQWMIILDNYLIPKNKLSTIARIILEGKLTDFLELSIYNSGLLINDFILPPGFCPEELRIKTPYAIKLHALLDNIYLFSERIIVYGGSGAMADEVFKLLKEYPDLNVIGIVDKALAGKEKEGIPVFRFEDIERLKPTMIIIAAEYSGQAIYEMVKHLNGSIGIIPLYDLDDPAWSVFIPEHNRYK